MFFILRQLRGNVCFYIIDRNEEYIIGRKDCRFLITGDASVSRKHAGIRIKDGSVKLVDFGAKYKTYHKCVEIKPHEEVVLEDGDEVQFGALQSKFRFQMVHIQTAGSRLSSEQNQRLKVAMKSLQGSVVNVWDDSCTHLTVQEVMLSIKVLHAVLDEKPIVSIIYWDKYLECVRDNLPPPSVNKLKPCIAEALLSSVSLEPDPRRRNLFEGKVFVFVTEKSKWKMEDIVKKAGGTCISWQKNPVSIEDLDKSSNEHLIIQGLGESVPADLSKLIGHLQKAGKRTIPVQEIAMSIVLCSVEKDCNPSFRRAEQVFKGLATQQDQSQVLLAPETHSHRLLESQEMRRNRPNIVINASLEDNSSLLLPSSVTANGCSQVAGPSSKRQQDVIDVIPDEHLNPPKRAKQEVEEPGEGSVNQTTSTVEELLSEVNVDVASTLSSSSLKSGTKRKSEESPNLPAKREKVFNPFTAAPSTEKKTSASIVKNPFAKIEEKVDTAVIMTNKDKPFKAVADTLVRGKEESVVIIDDSSSDSCSRSQLQKHPFASFDAKPRKTDNCFSNQILSSTMNQQPVNQTMERLDLSRIRTVTVLPATSGCWLRKGLIKTEPSYARENMDPNLESYCKSFRNCVVINPMTTYVMRDKKCTLSEIPDSLDGTASVVNFKKFRKVRPLRPQTTIIYCQEPQPPSKRGQTGVVVVHDSDEDRGMADVRPVTSRSRKKFGFA